MHTESTIQRLANHSNSAHVESRNNTAVKFSSLQFRLFTCLPDTVKATCHKNSECGENMNVLAGQQNVKLCGLYLSTLYGKALCCSILCPSLKRKGKFYLTVSVCIAAVFASIIHTHDKFRLTSLPLLVILCDTFLFSMSLLYTKSHWRTGIFALCTGRVQLLAVVVNCKDICKMLNVWNSNYISYITPQKYQLNAHVHARTHTHTHTHTYYITIYLPHSSHIFQCAIHHLQGGLFIILLKMMRFLFKVVIYGDLCHRM